MINFTNNLSNYKEKKAHNIKPAPIAFGGATKYVVENAEKPVIEAIATVGNYTSGLAYMIAGPALLSEFIHKKFSPNSEKKDLLPAMTPILTQRNKFFDNNPINQQNLINQFTNNKNYAQFLQTQISKSNVFENTSKEKNVSFSSHSGGVETLKPQTEFGKIGLKAARFATLTAGAAGFVNGVAMRLPVLATGEALTMLAAPIIETPVGIAIFGIGLGINNLARVLDSDPRFKIDTTKLKSLSITGKAGYILTNMKDTAAELGKSTKVIGKKALGLLGKNWKESMTFFKTHVFSTNPTQLIFKESIDKEGKVLVEKAMKTSPYMMHFATLVMGVGAGSIILFNKLKQAKAEKASLRLYNVGNSMDNIALSKWGIEKFNASPSPAYKTSGACSALAGLSILTGQAGLDKDWGRGLAWTGIGLILVGFGVERNADVFKILKSRKTKKAVTSLVRQWRIDLDKFFKPEELKQKITINGKEKTKLKAIIEAVNSGEKIPDRRLNGVVRFIERTLKPEISSKHKLSPDFGENIDAVQNELKGVLRNSENLLKPEIVSKHKLSPEFRENFNAVQDELKGHEKYLTHEGTFFEKLKDVKESIAAQSEKIFGKDPKVVEEIIKIKKST